MSCLILFIATGFNLLWNAGKSNPTFSQYFNPETCLLG